ncbi:EH domain-binding protein 1 isoform X2 [Drosophila busckii]|uniref:EH domain-binding protein 1 isoform X2 n=1 Tax=Drosophila busckii TaxID=30019 RepID=UPI00083EB065|nr:EH domain-binding protein 1 isoform X2 [Drosophila busckii]
MGSVWKRLQRVNKRAAKFQFTASYHDLRLETTAKWRPSNLSVVWTRRSRRVASAPLPWEPDMMNPLVGNISWPVPDNHAISVTLFKDPRTHELEDKDWTFVIEDISALGKKRVLANASINMRKYASIESTQQSFTLNLKPVSRKISGADLELTISCVFLREGKATDEDMQSVVSLMSVNNNCDVAPLDDLEDIPDLDNSGDISDHLYDFTQQLELMTTSLNGCIDVPTPLSADQANEPKTPANAAAKPNNEMDLTAKTPSAMPTLPATTKVTDEANDEVLPKPLELPTARRQERFHEMLTSTPVERVPPQTPSETDNNKKIPLNRALSFEKSEDKQANSYVEQSAVTSNKSITTTTTTTTSTTKTTVIEPAECVAEETKATPKSSAVASSAKRSELPPLNLKKSYEPLNNTQQQSNNSNSNSLKPVEKIVLKENTPGQDLLEWCKEVTKDYPNVKVTNLTTSWRNGMAFCAIIHHFMPELIDMTQLSAHDVVGNCRTAFDAAETLGIPRVIEPRDMNLLTVPDKLAVMTYLHQLRAHFTGKQLQIEQIGSTADESSYVIGDYKSDNLSQNLINFSHLKTHLRHQNSLDEDILLQQQQQLSPNGKQDVKNLILSSSKNILGKVLSPTKEKNTFNSAQSANLSGKSLLGRQTPLTIEGDTFEDIQKPVSPTSLDPNATNRILTRHKEMSERAKLMMEKLKISSASEANDEERQQRLREQARRLILDTRNKTGAPGPGSGAQDSPTSPTKLKRLNITATSPKHNGSGGGGGNQMSPSHRFNERNSPLQSFNAVVERISPKHEKRGDKLSYIESELEALEREQEAIDLKASNLEAKLRAVMGGNPSNNRSRTNSFLRLIRNSIGGGDVIRIKLLGSDDESLFGSGVSAAEEDGDDDGDNDDDDDDADNDDDAGTHSETSACSEEHLRRVKKPMRPRALSCFVNGQQRHTYQQSHGHEPQRHHVHHVPVPFGQHLWPPQQSNCDRLPAYVTDDDDENEDDDDALVMSVTGHAATCRRRRRSRGRQPRRRCETEETEEQLLSQWFTLVNKKNALLRRQMQLNILEQEKDLERKFSMLERELRAAQSVEDWRKTEAQREKERLLLDELVTIVDKRDQLVQHLHNQEIAIEDDHEIARELEQVDISGGKEKCVIQ